MSDLQHLLSQEKPKPTEVPGLYHKPPSNRELSSLQRIGKRLQAERDALTEELKRVEEDEDVKVPPLIAEFMDCCFANLFCKEDGARLVFSHDDYEELGMERLMWYTEVAVEALNKHEGKSNSPPPTL